MSDRNVWVAGPTEDVVDLQSKAVMPADVMTCQTHPPLTRKTAAGTRQEKEVKLAKTPAHALAWAENFRQKIARLPSQTDKTKQTKKTDKSKKTKQNKKTRTGEETAGTGYNQDEQHGHDLTQAIGSGLACRACRFRHQNCDTQVPVCTNCRAENTQDLCTYDELQQLRCIGCEKEDSPCDHRLPCSRCIEFSQQAECFFMIGGRQFVSELGRLTSKYTRPSTAGRIRQRGGWAGRTTRYRRTRVPAGSRKEGQHSNVSESTQSNKRDTSLKSGSDAAPNVDGVGRTRSTAGPILGSRLRDRTKLVPAGGRKKRQRSDESESTRPKKSRKSDTSIDSGSNYSPSPSKDEASLNESESTENKTESEESQEEINTLVESTDNKTDTL
ncbi:MAG: hypothetical protein Q9210_001860 [Variospora velana]